MSEEKAKRRHQAGEKMKLTSPLQADCIHCKRWFYCTEDGTPLDRQGDIECEAPQDTVRTFMSAAYLLPLEKGLYGLYRSVLQEDPETGAREKVGKPIGPIKLLRPQAKDEDESLVRIRTTDPVSKEPLNLVEVQP